MTVYEPLLSFCEPLSISFPELCESCSSIRECMKNDDWSLIRKLGPGCTKSMILASIKRDENTFFSDENNPFTQFIGGRSLYDRLVCNEKDVYWGDSRLVNIIRQCMVLTALEPMTSKLKGIVSKITDISKGGQMDQSSIINTLLSDPTLMSSMLGLMDSPDSMKTLMTSLRTIVDGMLTDVNKDVVDDEGVEVEDERDEKEDNDTNVDALASPGRFLKHENKKRRKRRVKKRKDNDILSMMNGIEIDEGDLQEISNDIKSMKPDDFSKMANDVTNLLGGMSGGDLNGMLQQLASGNIKGMFGE